MAEDKAELMPLPPDELVKGLPASLWASKITCSASLWASKGRAVRGKRKRRGSGCRRLAFSSPKMVAFQPEGGIVKSKFLIALSFALLAPGASFAACTGSGSFAFCTDDSGNSYNVRRIGNTTYVDGNNAQTGSNWSQSSQTIGNTTYHQGTAANGNTWNGTTTNIGGTTYQQGTDSRGNFYSKTCNQFGCF